MAIIQLSQGRVATVCDCHYDLVRDHKWSYSPIGYAVSRIGGKVVYMHRVIIGAIKGREIDHINEDKLDNRCVNLRSVNRRENTLNRGLIITNTSGYKGVSWNKAKSKWQTQLVNNGKRVFSAYFNDVIEAARAYNENAIKYHGEFARLNEGV